MSALANKTAWVVGVMVLCVGLAAGVVISPTINNADAAKKPLLKTLWAVVAADATLVRGKGVTDTKKIDSGQYEIDFNRDISHCAYTVTLSNEAAGETTTREGSGGVRSTDVITRSSSANTNADAPFHLVVNC